MRVIDLMDEHRELFSRCLCDWSEDTREGAPRRTCWVERFLTRGLRAKLALEDTGQIAGMIQYLPIEQSLVEGQDLYFVQCIWVHGHRQGPGNLQGHGLGTALLEAAEQDARALGARGMAAWGLWLPFWMKASWFKRHGYRKVDRQGMMALLWKSFAGDAEAPRWSRTKKHLPELIPGKVTVTAFTNGWCNAANQTIERARRAAAEFGDRVVFREIEVTEPAQFREWGRSDELFIDQHEVHTGPPQKYEKLRKLIARRVGRL